MGPAAPAATHFARILRCRDGHVEGLVGKRAQRVDGSRNMLNSSNMASRFYGKLRDKRPMLSSPGLTGRSSNHWPADTGLPGQAGQ
jgi:hypothetical protein